uniref:Uncharacterized protein n=1 Tax=Anguilla anguilla TaxID=7936 RepID=A0A0E9TUF7_ANGAN
MVFFFHLVTNFMMYLSK